MLYSKLDLLDSDDWVLFIFKSFYDLLRFWSLLIWYEYLGKSSKGSGKYFWMVSNFMSLSTLGIFPLPKLLLNKWILRWYSSIKLYLSSKLIFLEFSTSKKLLNFNFVKWLSYSTVINYFSISDIFFGKNFFGTPSLVCVKFFI